jgi:ankyrin repeat protein
MVDQVTSFTRVDRISNVDTSNEILVDRKLFQEIDSIENTLEPKGQSKAAMRKQKSEIAYQSNIQEIMNSPQTKASQLVKADGNDSELRKLIDECKNNPYHLPPLAYAVGSGYYDVVKFFIKAGESVNGLTPQIPIYSTKTKCVIGFEKGISPLSIAIVNQDVKMVELLLANGADRKFVIKTYLNIEESDDNMNLYYTNDDRLEPFEMSLEALADNLGNLEIYNLIKGTAKPKI